jgi:hypothetical protein
MQPVHPIATNESPRKILAADFKSLRGELPIRGGWGYTREDACIIDKNDPVVDPSLPFDGVGLEYLFVEKRIYEEMIIARREGDEFSGIEWTLQEQNLIDDAGRKYERLLFDITAFHHNDWEELKSEFEGAQGCDHPDFDLEAHKKKRQNKMMRFTKEFWFDITSFYGQGG